MFFRISTGKVKSDRALSHATLVVPDPIAVQKRHRYGLTLLYVLLLLGVPALELFFLPTATSASLANRA